MILLSLALAAELGANAPSELKPCPKPVIERQAPPTDPNYHWLTHIRRLPVCEGSIGPLSSFAERGEEIDYTTGPSSTVFERRPSEASAKTGEQDDAPSALQPVYEDGANGAVASFGPYLRDAVYMVGVDAGPGVTYLPGAISTVYRPAPISPVPEPEVWWLLIAGLGAIAWRRKRT